MSYYIDNEKPTYTVCVTAILLFPEYVRLTTEEAKELING